MDELSKGERTPRPEHEEVAKTLGLDLPSMQQLADQNALIADALYDLAKNSANFLTPDDWQEAKTKVKALNPSRFPFEPGGGVPSPTTPPFAFVGSPNFWPAGVPTGEGLALVIHTSVSSLTSMDNEFGSSAAQVSATFGVGLDGTVHQYVGIYDAAWANGILEAGNHWPIQDGWNPNQRSISIETVDNGDTTTPVTDAQYESVLWCYRTLVQPAHPEMKFILGHYIISPLSRSCPASRWRDSGRLQQLASDTGLTLIA